MSAKRLRIHAMCLALNEECFIAHQLRMLYPFCSGISVLTQYDRDWYGQRVTPDATVATVLAHPDPEGKLSLVVRRWPDEAACRNHELLAWSRNTARGIESHGNPLDEILAFHETPDYFLILDPDEFFDIDAIDRVLGYLADVRPRGMRMHVDYYLGSWNRRVPRTAAVGNGFVFIKPGVRFERQRAVIWNEARYMRKEMAARGLQPPLSRFERWFDPDRFREWVNRFVMCPPEIGVLYHGAWLGDMERLRAKLKKSASRANNNDGALQAILSMPTTFVPTSALPRNIREASWPASFLEQTQE